MVSFIMDYDQRKDRGLRGESEMMCFVAIGGIES